MRKATLFLVLIMVFVLVQPALAVDAETQENSIYTNLGLYGGQPEVIAVEYGSGNLYVANYASSAVFSSNDGGAVWTGLPSDTNYGVAKSVAVDQDTGDAYALIGDNFLKSTDNGNTWTDLNPETGITNYDRAIVIGHDRILIALNDGSILIGEEMGASYTTAVIEAESDIWRLAVSPTTDTYYAVTEDNDDNSILYISTDGGSTWNDIHVHSNGVASDSQFSDVGIDPLDAGHIVITSDISGHYAYQTFDNGASWQAITVEGSGISGSYVDWDGAGKMYMSRYYTSDASADPITWTTMESETPLSSSGFDFLVVDRDDPEVLYVGTGLGVAKSEDRGQSWIDIVDGIEAVKIYTFSQAEDKDIAWIGANGGLGRTTNFTANDPDWNYPILPDQSTAHWLGVWVKADNPDVVVAAAGTTTFYKTENGTDASPTWTQATVPSEEAGQVKQIIVDSNDNTLYAVIMDSDLGGADDGMIWKSIDEGTTWTDLEITNDVPAQTITLTSNGIVFAGIGGDATTRGVYMMNTDEQWSKPSTDLDDFEVTSIVADPDDANTLYATVQASTEGGLYKTTDLGVNWTQVTEGLDEAMNYFKLAVQSSTDPNTLYLAVQLDDLNGGIYKSNNAGESWNLLYSGLKQEQFYTLFFDGLIAGNDRGLYEIKSRPSLAIKINKRKVKRNKKVKITFTLNDKVTEKKLKNKKLKVYHKIGKKKWKLYKTVKTNKKGKETINIKVKKATRFKAKWNPTGNFAEEYSRATSEIRRVTLKK